MDGFVSPPVCNRNGCSSMRCPLRVADKYVCTCCAEEFRQECGTTLHRSATFKHKFERFLKTVKPEIESNTFISVEAFLNTDS